MAGGNWDIQNKVLPGVYVNLAGQNTDAADTGVTGVVGLPVTLPWLPEQTVIKAEPRDAAVYAASYGSAALPIQEAAKEAGELLIYRLNKGTAATGTIGGITCKARYSGTFGNSLKVAVQTTPGESGSYSVITYHGAMELHRQKVKAVDDVASNDWILFSGTGKLTAVAAAALTGGTDGEVTNSDYANFLAAMEVQNFDAVACPNDTEEVKALFVTWAKRLVNEEGRYIQVVVPNIQADFEGVISVANGVYLEDGTHVDKAAATAYVAGATAGVGLSGSLTNHEYPGAVDVDQRYTIAEQEDLATSGQMLFIPAVGSQRVTIQKDINTLVTLTDERPYAFSKNRIVRILYAIASQCVAIGMERYVGKMFNTPAGHDLYKGEILAYLRQLENQGALTEVSPDNITVQTGTAVDSVLITMTVKPADTMDVIYLTVNVQ